MTRYPRHTFHGLFTFFIILRLVNTVITVSMKPCIKIGIDILTRVRRLRAIALETFKILNNQTPVYLSDIFT